MRRGGLIKSIPFKAGVSDARFANSLSVSQSSSCTLQGSYTSYTDFATGLSGFLTGFKMHFWSGSGNIAIMTANPSNLVVRDISENIPVSGGADVNYDFLTPLAYVAGDFVGIWSDRQAGGSVQFGLYTTQVDSGIVHYNVSNVLKPSIGSDLDGGGWVSTTFGANNYVVPIQLRGMAA